MQGTQHYQSLRGPQEIGGSRAAGLAVVGHDDWLIMFFMECQVIGLKNDVIVVVDHPKVAGGRKAHSADDGLILLQVVLERYVQTGIERATNIASRIKAADGDSVYSPKMASASPSGFSWTLMGVPLAGSSVSTRRMGYMIMLWV